MSSPYHDLHRQGHQSTCRLRHRSRRSFGRPAPPTSLPRHPRGHQSAPEASLPWMRLRPRPVPSPRHLQPVTCLTAPRGDQVQECEGWWSDQLSLAANGPDQHCMEAETIVRVGESSFCCTSCPVNHSLAERGCDESQTSPNARRTFRGRPTCG